MQDKYNLTLEENIFLAKKMLVSNVYSNARIEGCNATFPETETILNYVPDIPKKEKVEEELRKITKNQLTNKKINSIVRITLKGSSFQLLINSRDTKYLVSKTKTS